MRSGLKAVWRKAWVEPYKKASGQSYRVRYYDDQNKQMTAGTFPTHGLADDFRRQFEQHLNDPTLPFPTVGTIVTTGGSTGLDWKQHVENWADEGTLKQTTRDTRRSRLLRFGVLASVDHTGQLTSAKLDNVCRNLRDVKGISASTIAGYIRVIDTFYRSLNLPSPVNEKIKSNWKPYALYVKVRPHFYTEDEFDRLLSSCDGVGRLCYKGKDKPLIDVNPGERDSHWWKTYISVLYWMGLRLEEVSHLIWHDVNLDAGRMKIQAHEGLPGVFKWSPKGKEIRNLVIPSPLIDLLQQMRLRADQSTPYVFLSNERYEFCLKQMAADEKSGRKKKRHLLNCVLQGYKRIRNRANIVEGDIHDFRRTFVTRWMDEPGVSPKDVQEMAGHANVTTTLNVYTMMREGASEKKVLAVYERIHGKAKSTKRA